MKQSWVGHDADLGGMIQGWVWHDVGVVLACVSLYVCLFSLASVEGEIMCSIKSGAVSMVFY